MRRCLSILLFVLCFPAAVEAGVVVVANFTPNELTFAIVEAGHLPQTIRMAPAKVQPVYVSGPCEINFSTRAAKKSLRLDPFNAYAFLPDEKNGLRLEGIELPGDPPERDGRPELNPPPREPLKIPATLLVDDADPRADALWQMALRKRFDEAAAVIEAHAGVGFEFAGYDTWRSDPLVRDVPGLLADFEAQVKVKPGQFAIGYTSRKVDEKPKEPAPFGACRPFPTRHVLIREWVPKAEPEKLEVLIHHLGLALGAALTPDGGSVMRPKIADGLALVPQYRFRFDPLNTLAMNLWADELRRGPLVSAADVGPANRIRLQRVYKALLKARPGDSMALTYLNEFDRELAKLPEPKKKLGEANPKNADPVPKNDFPHAPREDVARAVVRAVTARGRANVGPDAISGDALTSAYVRVAAEAALASDAPQMNGPHRVAGFLLGLAVAFDDTDALLNDVLTETAAKAVEQEPDRGVRLAVLGNPTVRGRRDLCRRFAIGCGMGELLPISRTEEAAVDRSLSLAAAKRATGIGFPAIAAELAGVAFAVKLREEPELLRQLIARPTLAEFLPNTDGLRDGLSVERFEEEYGDAADDRFQTILVDIRARLKKGIGHP